MNVSLSGTYEFLSHSSMDTYGYLYTGTFDPVDPSRNRIDSNSDGCDNQQFWLHSFLQANSAYTLVVTTLHTNVTGAFSIVSHGESDVSFTRLGEYVIHRFL
jgi:hypothetical protein